MDYINEKKLIWACKCNAIEVAKKVGWEKFKWQIDPKFGTITNHFGSKNLYKKEDSRKKDINGSFNVACGQELHAHFGCKKSLAMMHVFNSMSLHCVSKKKSCCWTCYPWYNGQNHGKLHVLSTLKRWITIITLFDLWKSMFGFNTFALVNSNWVPCHVIMGLFKVVDTSRITMTSQFQHLLELFFLWWHVPLWHFVLYNKVLGFAMPLAKLVNMFIITTI